MDRPQLVKKDRWGGRLHEGMVVDGVDWLLFRQQLLRPRHRPLHLAKRPWKNSYEAVANHALVPAVHVQYQYQYQYQCQFPNTAHPLPFQSKSGARTVAELPFQHNP